jgi:hypothetical protein
MERTPQVSRIAAQWIQAYPGRSSIAFLHHEHQFHATHRLPLLLGCPGFRAQLPKVYPMSSLQLDLELDHLQRVLSHVGNFDVLPLSYLSYWEQRL